MSHNSLLFIYIYFIYFIFYTFLSFVCCHLTFVWLALLVTVSINMSHSFNNNNKKKDKSSLFFLLSVMHQSHLQIFFVHISHFVAAQKNCPFVELKHFWSRRKQRTIKTLRVVRSDLSISFQLNL